jgi:hypothetical protein
MTDVGKAPRWPMPADLMRELRLQVERRRGISHLKQLFRKRLGYSPDFRNPSTLNEKINARKLHDRNPVFPILVDKIRVRDFVAERLGADEAGRLFLPVLGQTRDPTPEWIAAQGKGIAIKANHGCGWNLFVRSGEALDAVAMSEKMRTWLASVHGAAKMEWAYALVEPWVFSEPLMLTKDGRCADDLKFSVMDGVCRFVQIEQDRFGNHTQHFLTPTGEVLPMKMQKDGTASLPEIPPFLSELRDLAERIAADFDYLRVDFLYAEDRWALNELTIYRGSGLNPFRPRHWDWDFGAMWTMQMVPRQIGQA